MANTETNQGQNPATNLIRTINGTTRNVLYYDPDLFDEKILLSISLVIDNEDIPLELHYNTVHDEDAGTSGTNWQPLEEITVVVNPIPQTTRIVGNKRVKPYTQHTYSISNEYDPSNNFTYEWEIIGPGEFLSSGTNFTGNSKTVDVNFFDRGTVTLKVKISNESGCFRYIIRNIFIGEVTRKMLVVRYPYF